MAAINDLINQIQDEDLRNRIQQEVNKMNKQKKFGLVFEEHLPECTPLYDIPIKVGASVVVREEKIGDILQVLTINDEVASCLNKVTKEVSNIAVERLATVAEFGNPIYPYLKPLDSVCNAPDSDLWHTLIEADNYHALQLLEYLYAGKVDCIYIDPPYNTGAKDWKYNNDYVDGSDAYRHSKWLSFIEKRLKIAKKLLNPDGSVLVVTIDEKEYLHLGCLLEEIFSNSQIQMITSVISAKGVVRTGQFSRVEEYIFVVSLGNISLIPNKYNMLDEEIKKETGRDIEWLGFRRRAPQAKRESRPNQFYPVYVENESGYIHSIGDVVKHGVDRNTIYVPKGCTALWPLSKDGDERLWSLVPDQARINLEKGYLKVKNWNKQKRTGTVYYLASGTIADIEEGRAVVQGRDKDGSILAKYEEDGTTPPKKVWNMKSHNAETYGTNILNNMLGKRFDYPKSVYAVLDILRFYTAANPQALILDFFAGSGTTLHAVNLLNAEDNGKRRCIMVTNNEVSADEAKTLLSKGIKPGDDQWNDLGIARFVTWPRTVCSIEGHDIKGKKLAGNYIGTNRSMAEGFKANAMFLKLSFLDKTAVSLGLCLKELLPILWMKNGSIGSCPSIEKDMDMVILPENKMAILINEDSFSKFAEALDTYSEIQTVFLATDYEVNYRSMVKNLNVEKTYQLYRDYLDHFRINHGRN